MQYYLRSVARGETIVTVANIAFDEPKSTPLLRRYLLCNLIEISLKTRHEIIDADNILI